MKVLHLISGGDTGGAKTHVLSLIKELHKTMEVTLVTLLEEEFYHEGLSMGLDIRLMLQKRRYNLGVVKRLRDLLKEEGFQILHCHGARANFVAALLRRYYRIPSLTTLHSDYRLDFQGNFYKNLVFTPLNAWALRKFDYYIAVSDSFKEMLIERGFPKERIFVVYNGIDFQSPLELTERESFLRRFELEIPPGSKIAGTVGRLHPVKGHQVLLEGARLVLQHEPDTHFIIAGDGEEKSKLLSRRDALGLQGNVHFVGYVHNPDELINILDVNLLTSFSESFPLVLLEGARLRKPTLSSAVGGIKLLVREGETGLLFQAGDSRHFATQLLRMLQNEEMAQQLGENLYQHARQNYSLEMLGKSHRGIYSEIIEGESAS